MSIGFRSVSPPASSTDADRGRERESARARERASPGKAPRRNANGRFDPRPPRSRGDALKVGQARVREKSLFRLALGTAFHLRYVV